MKASWLCARPCLTVALLPLILDLFSSPLFLCCCSPLSLFVLLLFTATHELPYTVVFSCNAGESAVCSLSSNHGSDLPRVQTSLNLITAWGNESHNHVLRSGFIYRLQPLTCLVAVSMLRIWVLRLQLEAGLDLWWSTLQHHCGGSLHVLRALAW